MAVPEIVSMQYSGHHRAGLVIGGVGFGKRGADPVRRVLTFTSPALMNDLDVTGPILLEMYASTNRTDTDFVIKLSDQLPRRLLRGRKISNPSF